ncbi:ABC transporter permease [Roseateles saccharophilus]|uniref:Putative ABC transport system permease protein n=1 Tax=Roseateles saccharophilus TaxID=304 RepID=A0A4V2VPF1_ROSSA|nr:ABC transporter permease [Roseateles saccharophilus]MDG0834470.1 ABC transporter permease [Roseateles saccharophilus]TCU89758.1 putative ABC transport system permease protein [Roseateles saccharophilus]
MTLWRHLCWPAWRDHPGRVILAIVAVMLGVALAFGVHLLNGAALAEFARAARSIDGQPDLVVRAASGPLTDADLAELLNRPEVSAANPVLEAQALWPGQTADAELKGRALSIRLIGLDPLALLASAAGARPLAPELLPQVEGGPAELVASNTVHLNGVARARLAAGATTLKLRLPIPGSNAPRDIELAIGGRIAAGNTPLGVLDIADAQALFGRLGLLDRIDLQLAPGVDAAAFAATLPPHWRAAPPEDEGARLADLTRAYRINLGLLALMALFTGSFLVYAVLSLATAQRLPQWALVGVLGVSARMRWRLILMEGLVIGSVGTALGLALGLGLAAGALKLLGSDLGLHGANGSSAELLFNQPLLGPALAYTALGLAAALVAALAPALTVRRIAPALVLKGLGLPAGRTLPAWLGLALLALGAALAWLPPVLGDTPLGAYLAMLCLLMGGLALVPALVRGMTATLVRLPAGALLLLARERSRDQATEARRSLAGVLVALALAVAMTVMIGSFRESLLRWLDHALPADLYVRSALRGADGLPAPLPAALVERLGRLPELARAAPQRSTRLRLAPGANPVALTARDIDTGSLPLVERWAGAPAPDAIAVWVNEAARDRDGLKPGRVFTAELVDGGRRLRLQVRGVWRDYSRQSSALWMDLADYRRASDDAGTTELALWLAPGQALDAARTAVRRLAGDDVELAAAGELRAMSLRIFDRSFAITVWLQAVALAVGLFGVVASQSAQALARRREFGLLRHLGLSQRALMRLLLIEASLTGGAGALAGLALGLGLSAVLVYVVNPQSFHWSMEMHLPLGRLTALVGLAFAAAVGASLLAGRRALGQDAVRAVREDA